jgi:hypothetical protein
MRSNRAIIELFTSSHHIRNGTAVLLSSLVAHLIEIRHNKDTVKAERIRMRYRDLYSNGVTGAVTIMNCLGFHGNADVLSLTFSLITAENMVTTNTNAAHELEPYGEPWRAASDTISPVFRQRLYNILSNRSLYSILEHIPWEIFSHHAITFCATSPYRGPDNRPQMGLKPRRKITVTNPAVNEEATPFHIEGAIKPRQR